MSDAWNPIVFSGHCCHWRRLNCCEQWGKSAQDAWLADCLSQAMPNQTPLLLENEVGPDLKVRIASPALPISSDIPPGPHTEARNLLLRFNPRLVGFGIASRSPNLCPGTSAPNQLCVVEPLTEKNSEDQQ